MKTIKRILIVLSILCVIALLGYTYNSIKLIFIRKAIEKEIQKIRDAGEPTTVEELVPVEIPDNENGALVYNEAFNLKKELEKRYAEEWKYMPYDGPKKWEEITEEQRQKIRGLLFNDTEFLKFYQLLEKASNMKCQFLKRKDYEKGASILLPHLASMRGCARMLAARAKFEAEEGKIDNALSTCLTGLKLSKSLTGESILLISQLVNIALDAIMLNQIEEVLNKGEAKTENYQVLMDEIKKEREEELIYTGFLGERFILEMIEMPRIPNTLKKYKNFKDLGGFAPGVLGKPSIENIIIFLRICTSPKGFIAENELTYLKEMAKGISLTKIPYWEVKDKLNDFEKELMGLPKKQALLTQLLMPTLNRAQYQEARIDAQLGSAEIALASRIYKARYGNYPSSLNQLAPEILSSLPLDPFTGRDFIYKRKGEGFIVYSLGDNCKDDGGNWGKPNKWSGDFDIVFEIKK